MIVRITSDISSDLGTVTTATMPDGAPIRVIEPPPTPLIHQLIAQLEPRQVQKPSRRLTRRDEAKALTGLTVRWGSWFALLVDPSLPLWSEAGKDGLSRIEQDEMARINVEASYALATLIDMKRKELERYDRLIRVALEALPPLLGKGTRDVHNVSGLLFLKSAQMKVLMPTLRAGLANSPQLAEVEAHPVRLLSNVTIQAAWRNGPVEDVHAGECVTCPLRRRRVTEGEERKLISTMWGRITVAVAGLEFIIADDGRTLADKVLPLAVVPGIAASG